MSAATPRRPVAAVVGAGDASGPVLAAAEAVGAGLVRAGFRVVTGGLGGVMEAASRGARQAAGDDDGRVIGILPGLDPSAANPWVDIVVPTGMDRARNALVVNAADVVVAVGGGAGTLSEIALAWQRGRPIVAVDVGEGWSHRLAGQRLDDRRPDRIHRAATADEAVALAVRLVGGGDRT